MAETEVEVEMETAVVVSGAEEEPEMVETVVVEEGIGTSVVVVGTEPDEEEAEERHGMSNQYAVTWRIDRKGSHGCVHGKNGKEESRRTTGAKRRKVGFGRLQIRRITTRGDTCSGLGSERLRVAQTIRVGSVLGCSYVGYVRVSC